MLAEAILAVKPVELLLMGGQLLSLGQPLAFRAPRFVDFAAVAPVNHGAGVL